MSFKEKLNSIDSNQIEEEAIVFFETKYPLMDLSVDDDGKDEIDWYDMIEFTKYLLAKYL